MATEQRNLFNPKIEALSEKYTDAMGQLAATPFTGAQISAMAPKVAPQTALQQQATQLTGSGIGSYQPFVTAAQQAGATAGTGLGLAQTGLGIAGQELTGAGTTLGTAGTQLTGAQQLLVQQEQQLQERTIYRCSRNRIRSSRYNTWWSITIYWCSRNRTWTAAGFNWNR